MMFSVPSANATTAASPAPQFALSSSSSTRCSDGSIKHCVGDDSVLCHHFLPDHVASTLLDEILEQVSWSEIRHKGKPLSRLVCIQGEILAIQHEHHQQQRSSHQHHHGNKHSHHHHDKKKTSKTMTTIYHPLYRNSADPQPTLESWSPAVRKLRDAVAASIRRDENNNRQQEHASEEEQEDDDCCFLNHAVLQLHHSDDRHFISEQADKTLDVVASSNNNSKPTVVYVSLGAVRTLTLRPKRQGPNNGERRPTPRPTTNILMPHASYFMLGSETNRKMTHEIKLNDNVAVPTAAMTTRHGTMMNTSPHYLEEESCSTLIQHNSDVRISIAFRSVATFVSPTTGQVFGRGARINKNLVHTVAAGGGAQPIPTSTNPLSIMSSSPSPLPPLLSPGTGTSTTSMALSRLFPKGHHQNDDKDGVEDSDTSDTASTSTTLTTPSMRTCLAAAESSLSRQAKELLHAFSRENKYEDFDWDKVYGKGFDVVHVHAAMFDQGDRCNGNLSDHNRDLVSPPTMTMSSCSSSISKRGQKRSGNHIKQTTNKTASDTNANPDKKGGHHHANVQTASDGVATRTTPPPRERNKGQFHQPKLDIDSSPFRTADSARNRSSPTIVIKNISFSSPQSLAYPTAPTVLNKKKSDCVGGGVALLAIDLQNDFLADGPDFYFSHWGSPIAPRRHELLKHVDDLARQVRSAGGIVVFVKSRYDGRGLCSPPQIPNGDDNQTSGVTKTSATPCCAVGTLGGELHKDAVALIKLDPSDEVTHGDLILTKSWYSAFMGTTLHAQFQRMGIRHVVVCGVTTNHSVAATVRAAAHKGYSVLLSSEGTAQIDPKLQCVTLKVLEPFCTAILQSNMKISDIIAPSPIESFQQQARRSSHANVLVFDGFDQLSGIGTGDSLYFPDLLSNGEAERILDRLHPRSVKEVSRAGVHRSSEIDWKPLRFGDHGCGSLPRLVACQASVSEDEHVPVYRSADPAQIQQPNMHEEEPERTARWTPSLDIIRAVVEDRAGHSFNWGNLLCYRDGKGDTFLQSDTCLDIVEDSFLAIFSLGQDREMELLPKEQGAASLAPQRISLRHNSLLLLGPQTSRMFLQFIRDYDNGTGKMVLAPSPTTKPRISIAFRSVATMYVRDGVYPAFYGQGTEYEHFPQLQKARTYLSRWERRTGTALAAGAASLMAMATSSRMDSLGGGIGSQQTMMSPLNACVMAAITATSTVWWKKCRRDHLQQHEKDRLLAHVHRECRKRSVTVSPARVMMLSARSSAKGETSNR